VSTGIASWPRFERECGGVFRGAEGRAGGCARRAAAWFSLALSAPAR